MDYFTYHIKKMQLLTFIRFFAIVIYGLFYLCNSFLIIVNNNNLFKF
jgi:hypothetical protein